MENFNQIESDILSKIKNVIDQNSLDSVKTEKMNWSIYQTHFVYLDFAS